MLLNLELELKAEKDNAEAAVGRHGSSCCSGVGRAMAWQRREDMDLKCMACHGTAGSIGWSKRKLAPESRMTF